MRTVKASLLMLLSVLFLSGCVYTHIRLPLDENVDRTVLGAKEGRASSSLVLWLVAWGDAGTAAAAKNGGITTVNHMDREVESILFGLYSRTTTVVYGD